MDSKGSARSKFGTCCGFACAILISFSTGLIFPRSRTILNFPPDLGHSKYHIHMRAVHSNRPPKERIITLKAFDKFKSPPYVSLQGSDYQLTWACSW
jgi:hypothetical protein